MKRLINLLIATVFLLPSAAIAETKDLQLTVTVKGIQQEVGSVRIAIFKDKKTYLTKNWVKGLIAKAKSNQVEFTFKNLPQGTYAISVFHDMDENAELDKNFVGAPTEPYGFSNDVFGVFGPPSFEKTKFELTQNQTMDINLN